MPIMIAGADDPATLSGFRQPMAKAMADWMRPSSQGGCVQAVELKKTKSRWKSRRRGLRSTICEGSQGRVAETRWRGSQPLGGNGNGND
jgi:hypothetical protein